MARRLNWMKVTVGRICPVDDVEITAGCGGAVDAFLAALTDGSTVPVTARDAYATLGACIAADESAATGKTLTPDTQEVKSVFSCKS